MIARLGNDLGWKRVAKIVTIASVRTIRRWFRRLLGQPDGGKAPGSRARTSVEIASLVVQCAQGKSWSSDACGAKRIVGEIKKPGISIAKSTVSAILRRHSIPPALSRGRVTDDDRSIVNDPATIAASDFAKVSILDHGTICLVSILFAFHLSSREIEIVNISDDPMESSRSSAPAT